MKHFDEHSLRIEECRNELRAFADLLAAKDELSERDDILPFFKSNRHLASFIGTYVPAIANPDLVAVEYDLFGDFTCDLAIGDSRNKTYLLVEFEDAKAKSLFADKGTKETPEWASRVEHGFSQVIDWFWKLSDMEKTEAYEHRFGTRVASVHGLVIVGRDQYMESREKARLKWRQEHTVVASKKVSVITFDQLLSDLSYRLNRFPEAARVDAQ